MTKSKVFIIGDTHFPYQSKKGMKQVYELIKKHKPTHVVQIGDLLDQYVFSKYSRSLEITPDTEITQGLNEARKMWETIQKIVPKAKCIQVLGNHDVRLAKRIAERLPELKNMFSHKIMYKFKNVTVLDSDRDFLEIDDVVYAHGWLSKSIDHARYFNKSTVHGHRHRPTIETDGKIWSMDVGYLADRNSTPLGYTMSKHTKWCLGSGLVENGKPTLFLLEE